MVGFILWDVIYALVILPQQKEYKTLQNCNYTYVVESGFETLEYKSLKKLDNIITFRSLQGNKSNVNVHIQSVNPLAVCEYLEPGEVAISRKLADVLKVEAGSALYADYPIYDMPVEYKVVKVLPYMSDFYNVIDNTDFSVAVVGDDGTLYNQANGKKIYFLNESEAKEYLDKEYSYSSRYDLNAEIDALFEKNMALSVIMIVFMVLVVTVCAYLAHKAISTEIIKYYHDGYNIGAMKKISIQDHVIVLWIPSVLQLLWMILSISDIRMLLAISAVILCTVVVTSFIGGRKFGRSNHI